MKLPVSHLSLTSRVVAYGRFHCSRQCVHVIWEVKHSSWQFQNNAQPESTQYRVFGHHLLKWVLITLATLKHCLTRLFDAHSEDLEEHTFCKSGSDRTRNVLTISETITWSRKATQNKKVTGQGIRPLKTQQWSKANFSCQVWGVTDNSVWRNWQVISC